MICSNKRKCSQGEELDSDLVSRRRSCCEFPNSRASLFLLILLLDSDRLIHLVWYDKKSITFEENRGMRESGIGDNVWDK